MLDEDLLPDNVLEGDQQSVSDNYVRPLSPSRRRRYSTWSVAALDCTLIYAAFSLAYFARYGAHIGAGTQNVVPFAKYQGVALLLLGIMMPVLVVKGAYRTRMSTEIVDEAVTIFSSVTTTVAAVLVITYMLHHFEFSRALIIYMWVLLIVLLILGRALWRGVQGMFHRRGLGTRRLLVVGASDFGKMIMQSVMNRPDLGYQIIGFVDRRSHTRVPDFGRFQRVGLLNDIPRLIETEEVDEVIVALPGSAYDEVRTVVRLCEGTGVGLKLVPDLFRVSMNRINVDDIAGIPLLDVQAQPLRRIERSLKRALDILFAGAAALLSLPIIGGLALLVKLDSDGPAFIRQERVAQGGRRFACFKLRTMHAGADRMVFELQEQNETIGPTFKMRKDPRVTNVGRYIRRYSLDELPQLWNVVRGDMSLVGPRPPLPYEVDQYEPWQRRRLQAKPGLTGLWQVSGRSNVTFDEMVMMDITYIDNWSLSLDLKIIMQTFAAVLAARGAY